MDTTTATRSPHLLVILLGLLAGTIPAQQLVKDIEPGAVSSQGAVAPPMADFYGTLLFRAHTSKYGSELWKSDGTTTGTRIVKDIRSGGSSGPDKFTILGRNLIFVADDGTNGRELWKSDGTAAGTVMIKNINPLTNWSLPPQHLTVLGDRVFFSGHDARPGYHLFVTDGSAAGTRLVTYKVSAPQHLFAFAGKVYFSGTHSQTGQELWVTDGTDSGTKLVIDLYPGGVMRPLWVPNSSSPRNFIALDGSLYFTATGKGIWRIVKTDGTAAGTAGFLSGTIGYPSGLTVVDTTLFFTGSSAAGSELWATDGTRRGSRLVKDIYPGPTGSNPVFKIASGGTCYFRAESPTHGAELWRSDGTTSGTTLVKDLYPGGIGAKPYRLTPVGSRGFCFAGDDKNFGKELWVSGGTGSSTIRMGEINPGSAGSEPSFFVLSGGKIFFWADDGVHGRELWRLNVGATAQSYGLSCGPGSPTLRATDPALGQTMTFVGESAPTSGYIGLLMVGAPVLPISALGCSNIYYSAFTNAVQLYAFAPSTSGWSFQLPVPNDISLLGLAVTAQTPYLWIPNGLQDLRLTNGVRLTVGW